MTGRIVVSLNLRAGSSARHDQYAHRIKPSMAIDCLSPRIPIEPRSRRMREWLARLLDWFRRDRLDADLADELRFHTQLLERDERGGGANVRDAAYAARRRLGNTTRTREDARDRWSVPWLDHLQQDM